MAILIMGSILTSDPVLNVKVFGSAKHYHENIARIAGWNVIIGGRVPIPSMKK
jgi:hypothetical protein